jgi:hypothetical protein
MACLGGALTSIPMRVRNKKIKSKKRKQTSSHSCVHIQTAAIKNRQFVFVSKH